MNSEKFMSVMGKIGDKYIDEAVLPEKTMDKSVENSETNKNSEIINFSRTKMARMCASLAIVIAACFAINFLYHMSLKNQLIITAYAADKNGKFSYEKVSDSIHVPVSVSKGSDGNNKFLFSMELPNGVMNSNVTITTDAKDEEVTTNNTSFSGFSADSDKIFFYIESSKDEFPQNLTFSYTDSNSNINEITLRISEENGKYDCILVKLEQH